MAMRKERLSLLLLFLVAACSHQPARSLRPRPDQTQTVGLSTTVPQPPAMTPESDEAGTAVNQPDDAASASAATADIAGLVMAESDAGGIADSPLSDQLVLLMPLHTADRLFGTGADLRFIQQDVLLEDPDVMIQISANDGTFNATMPPGEAVLCLADEFSAGVGTTRGCARFTAQAGSNSIIVSVGFGEILLKTS